MPDQVQIEDYDSDPWYYCATCLSPNIKHEESLDLDCCGACGSMNIVSSTFEEWEKKYIKRYGHKYVEKTEDPEKTYIFNLPFDQLKSRVYEDSHWKDIIHAIYPSFPGGLGRADSVILFFNTLIKDGKLGELKLLLLKRFKY